MTTRPHAPLPEPTPTRDGTFRRALRVIDRSGVAAQISTDLTASTGRPRVLPFRALLVVLLVTAMGQRQLLMTEAAQVLRGLTPQQCAQLGLDPYRAYGYSHIESGVADIALGGQAEVNRTTGEEFRDARLTLSLSEISNLLIAASIPRAVAPTGSIAIDATDHETWGARRSRTSIPSEPSGEHDDKPPPSSSTSRWPRTAADGRHQHSVDPDARDGYRSGKNMEHKSIFLGYHIHIAVDVPALGGAPVTPLARAIDVVPAGDSSPAAALRIIDSLTERDTPVQHVIADRGYTYATASSWALPLISRGITQTLDLHTNQHVTRPGPIPGTVMVDGGLFSSGLPKRLRELKRPSLGATAAEKAASAELFDKRLPYQFAPYGPVHRDGRRRYRGPALTGRLRCPNVPTSMRASHALPLSSCEPGESCACGRTVTVDAEVARERQQHPYGTTKWVADYGRRSAIESYNASLKTHHGALRRGCIRVMGQEKNTLFLGLLVAACNLAIVAAHHLDPSEKPVEGRSSWTRPTNRSALHRRLWPGRGSPPPTR